MEGSSTRSGWRSWRPASLRRKGTLMATMQMSNNTRSNLWEVSSRVVVYAAIGAVLYGLLLVIQIPIRAPRTSVCGRPSAW
jgi:hypothetical protein